MLWPQTCWESRLVEERWILVLDQKSWWGLLRLSRVCNSQSCLNDKEGMRASWGIIFVGSLSWTRETLGASWWFLSISFCIKLLYWQKYYWFYFCCYVWKTKVTFLICITCTKICALDVKNMVYVAK